MIKNNHLYRISFHPLSSDLEEFSKKSWSSFVDQQLSPNHKQDHILNEKLEKFRFTGEDRKGKPFVYLYQKLNEYWKSRKDDKKSFEKHKKIILSELWAKTVLYSTHSKFQLHELLVQFWHNHFNINVFADELVGFTALHYDQEVIRKHCLGNFREFLEAVAKSPSMLYYLDNTYSRASPANENYARELFELHTLGKENYYNHLYDRWKEVPGATEGKAIGYIDEDVYEAARAFTGWTFADGSWGEEQNKVDTGEFLYYEKWHDNYQKRVMGMEIPSNQPPMTDGYKVLDLLANHEGTAKHICTKLCKRFIGDQPSETTINQIVKIWISNKDAPDQLKQVVKAILLSKEFENGLQKKLKNPFELLISAFRTLELDISPNDHLNWIMKRMGYHLFSWPTPTGHPDENNYWINSNMILKRWNAIGNLLMHDWHRMFKVDTSISSDLKTPMQVVNYFTKKILGSDTVLSDKDKQVISKILEKEEYQKDLFWNEEDQFYKVTQVISLIIQSPAFQYR